MKKSAFLEAIKDLSDDDEIAVGILLEKDEPSFEIGKEDEDKEDSDDSGDSGVVDNGDGTVTDCHEIQAVTIVDDIEDLGDGTTKPVKIALLTVDMLDDDEEDEEEDEDEDED